MEFKEKFNKFSSSPQELEYRYNIFVENMKYIEELNSQNNTFTVGINQFSDLTWEEFQKAYLSEPIPHQPHTNGKVESVTPVDWREKKVVTPVKNQAMCGSCWAFSTTGSLEAALAIKTGKLSSLSEQELVDCSRTYGNHGCNGGLMSLAFDYIKKNEIGTESDYPYRGRDGSCHRKSSGDRFGITGYQKISPANVAGLSKAVVDQPVSVAIEVRRSFQMYTGGIYTSTKDCGYALNHGVLLVGQKDNYYIVKNSWGGQWGEKGYVRMAIGEGSGTCGIANPADVYPLV